MPQQESKTEAKTAEKKAETKEKKAAPKKGKLAAILIRGRIGANPDTRSALDKLKLFNKNNCVVVEDNPNYRGSLKKVKDFITWGEISETVVKDLETRKASNNVYTLHPPRGGFERKGIKVPYTRGGVLGYRGDQMEKLLRKML